jgi:MFS family permease
VTYLISFLSLAKSPARHLLPSSFDLSGMLLAAASLSAFALSTTFASHHPGVLNAGLAMHAVAGFAGLIDVERRAASPLIDIDRLMERSLATGLLSLSLVSTILMATLVVGPFHLVEALSLTPVQTGLVMSLGPAVAALAGLPAGRLVDRYGSGRTMTTGLSVITTGAALMTVLPGLLGTGGYAGSLIVISAGYAPFQAANTTAAMSDAPSDRRGVTSGLLGLARNLGLNTGASAMGASFAMRSHGIDLLGLPPGRVTGPSLTFGVATVIAAIAGGISLRSIQRAGSEQPRFASA